MNKKCSACGRESKKTKCKHCQRKEATRQKRVREERSLANLCLQCGFRGVKNGKRRCPKCLKINGDNNKRMRLRRINNNLCSYCGKRKPDKNFKLCRLCLDQCQRSRHLKNSELINNRMCTKCRKNKHLDSMMDRCTKYRFCLECYIKHCSTRYLGSSKRYRELLIKLEEQNYICPYSGDTIIVGDNSSVDHILPTSKFPELKWDINNLQWVCFLVNKMKFNQTEEEFKVIIKRIHDYLKL